MKNTRRVIVLLLALVTALSLSACSLTRDALTADAFIAAMEEEGFIVEEITDQFEGQVARAIISIPEHQGYQIEFYQVDTVEQAKQAFGENKGGFESISGVSSNLSLTGTNFEFFSMRVDGEYMVVSRIENTFLYLRVADSYKDEVDDVLDKLGY